MNSPTILEIVVSALGVQSEHKVKAALSSNEIVTFYPNTGVLSVHSNDIGGLGRFTIKEYAHPQVIKQMQAAYDSRTLNDYTVIGYYESNGQIFCHHVKAGNIMGAFAVVASMDSDCIMVCAHLGKISEGESLAFPGEGVVDAETILEQPEIYGGGHDE